MFLTRKTSVKALLTEMERAESPQAGWMRRRRQAGNHGDPSIRGRVRALGEEDAAGAENEAIKKFREALNLKGTVAPGQEIFQRLCSSCHRLNGLGNEVGPNLALSATRSPDELLTTSWIRIGRSIRLRPIHDHDPRWRGSFRDHRRGQLSQHHAQGRQY